MVTRSFLFMLKNSILFACVFLVFGCGHIKTRKDIKDQSKQQTEEVEQEQEKEPVDEVIGDFKPPVVTLPKVGVILGPGGMKSFAHSGVLKALLDKKINIDYIVGFEWGSLVASYYAQSAKIHEVEWQLYKLKEEDLIKRSFLSKDIESIELSTQLTKLLSDKQQGTKLKDYQVPFACPTQSVMSGQIHWLMSGNTKNTLQKCAAFPPIHSLKSGWVAASFELDKAIEFLKSKGMELVIVVDVLKHGGNLLEKKDVLQNPTASVLWQQVRQTWSKTRSQSGVEWIHVNTRQYNLYSQKKKLLIMAGDQEGRKAAVKIADKYGF